MTFAKLLIAVWLLGSLHIAVAESLPPLVDGKAPETADELWGDYDPRAEPLEVEVLKEWESEGIVHKVLRYRIGVFKGQKAMMAATYSCPKDGENLPGLVHLHGGGQSAQHGICAVMAQRGYAAISLAWAGRIQAPGYQVNHGMMQTFFDGKTNDPNYRVTTDWGALDGYHAPNRYNARSLPPGEKPHWHLDPVESPRNNPWFLWTLAARRALTFLEQQPEVDRDRLGVFGHSMGGQMTAMVAGVDRRVKAAAPSCGGEGAPPEILLNRSGAGAGRPRTGVYWEPINENDMMHRIDFPIMYVGPHNDFNGRLDTMYANWRGIPDASKVWFSISPHFNHRHAPEAPAAQRRFFDAVLKGEGTLPATPTLEVALDAPGNIPVATVRPDAAESVARVQIYYSQNPNMVTRFWRRADMRRKGDTWEAALPVMSTDLHLHVMASVYYLQPDPPTYLLSSWDQVFEPEALKAAGVKATDRPERMIVESFDGWLDFYRVNWGNTHHQMAATRKLTDPKWRGPDGAVLAVDVLDPKGGEFVMTLTYNSWWTYHGVASGGGTFSAPLAATNTWQTLRFRLEDLMSNGQPADPPRTTWQGITELGIPARQGDVGGIWGPQRKLRNLRWEGGSYDSPVLLPGGELSSEDFEQLFQDNIDDSIRLEDEDRRTSALAVPAAGVTVKGSPAPYQVVQRDGNDQGSIPVIGAYSGTVERVEARAVVMSGDGNNGTPTDWQVIDAAPIHGLFKGSLNGVAAGGWYEVQVRGVSGAAFTAVQTVAKVGVGDVFITAGQSNSAGHGSPAYEPKSDRVSMRFGFSGNTWGKNRDPQWGATKSYDGGSPWARLGEHLVRELDIPIGFLATGVGGSGSKNWNPLLPTYTKKFRPAITSFPTNGFRAVLWHQGETDSLWNAGADYARNLLPLIGRSRADAGWNVPWYISEASFTPDNRRGDTPGNWGYLASEEGVAAAQRSLAFNDQNVFLGPVTDFFHLEAANGGKLVDPVHFNGAGLDDHARQWKEILTETAPLALRNGAFGENFDPAFTGTPALDEGARYVIDIRDRASPSVLGWRVLDAAVTTAADGTNGVFNPDAATYAAEANRTNYVAFLEDGSAGNGFRQFTRHRTESGTTYRLIADIGVRDDAASFGGATLAILANGQVAASKHLDKAALDALRGGNCAGTFTTVQVDWPATEDGLYLAAAISKSAGTGTMLDFDNVQLISVE